MNKEELKKEVSSIYWKPKKQTLLDLIDQLDEPEKPVVPSFVAEWIEINKKHYSLSTLLKHKALKQESDELYQWVVIKDNEEVICRAWFEGYTVEEKKYRVNIHKHGYYLVQRRKGEEVWFVTGYGVEKYKREGAKTTFTEKEINAIDPRYMAFVEEVTE